MILILNTHPPTTAIHVLYLACWHFRKEVGLTLMQAWCAYLHRVRIKFQYMDWTQLNEPKRSRVLCFNRSQPQIGTQCELCRHMKSQLDKFLARSVMTDDQTSHHLFWPSHPHPSSVHSVTLDKLDPVPQKLARWDLKSMSLRLSMSSFFSSYRPKLVVHLDTLTNHTCSQHVWQDLFGLLVLNNFKALLPQKLSRMTPLPWWYYWNGA